MNAKAFVTVVLGIVAMAPGCGVSPDEGARASIILDAPELPQGCYWDCPCSPGEPCPPTSCRGICPTGEICGEAICPDGEVCCNASCGICATPDAWCIQDACGVEDD